MKILLLLFLPLSACQYHGPSHKYVPLPEIRDILKEEDKGEYYALWYACKSIRDTQRSIGDIRLGVDDCIAVAVTSYLKRVNSLAAQVLLRDLQNKNFKLD